MEVARDSEIVGDRDRCKWSAVFAMRSTGYWGTSLKRFSGLHSSLGGRSAVYLDDLFLM